MWAKIFNHKTLLRFIMNINSVVMVVKQDHKALAMLDILV
jgi:hypothetical protein